jgi:hypothetical protein
MWKTFSVALVVLSCALGVRTNVEGGVGDEAVVSVQSASATIGGSRSLTIAVSGLADRGLGAWTLNITPSGGSAFIEGCGAAHEAVCTVLPDSNVIRIAGAASPGIPGDNTALGELHVRCNDTGVTTFEIAVEVLADATIGGPQAIAHTIQNGQVACMADVHAIVSVQDASLNGGSSASLAVVVSDLRGRGLGAWTVDITKSGGSASLEGCSATYDGVCNTLLGPNVVRIAGAAYPGIMSDSVVLGSLRVRCLSTGTTTFEISVLILSDATVGDPQPIGHTVQHGEVTCAAVAASGDVNCDGSTTAEDALLILQYAAGMISSLPCEVNADVNSDGRVDSIDALFLLQYVAGLISVFP